MSKQDERGKKKIFITGATGFLGTNLLQLLTKQNLEIYAIKRETSNLDAFCEMNIHWSNGDLLDYSSLDNACPENLDYVFHLAADTNMWAANNNRQTQVNLQGTANIIRLAKQKNAKRLIHTSSIAAFGIHEDRIDEQTPQQGNQCFANYYKTKHESELLVKSAVNNDGLDAVILNPCHLVGPWDRNNWSQMLSMVDDGSLPGVPPGFGSFCHITEVAKAHWQAALVGKKGENYILSGTDASFVEFVQEIGRLLNKKVPRKPIPRWILSFVAHLSVLLARVTGREPDMTPEKVLIVSEVLKVNGDKAKAELNYNTEVPLKKMLSDCYQWMLAENLIGIKS